MYAFVIHFYISIYIYIYISMNTENQYYYSLTIKYCLPFHVLKVWFLVMETLVVGPTLKEYHLRPLKFIVGPCSLCISLFLIYHEVSSLCQRFTLPRCSTSTRVQNQEGANLYGLEAPKLQVKINSFSLRCFIRHDKSLG